MDQTSKLKVSEDVKVKDGGCDKVEEVMMEGKMNAKGHLTYLRDHYICEMNHSTIYVRQYA